MSPLMLALIGVLAYQAFQNRGKLGDLLGKQSKGGEPDASPANSRETGTSGAGGLSDLLGSLLGGSPAAGGSSPGERKAETSGGGQLGGLLGGLLGGSAVGGALSSGLQDLLRQFEKSGQGDKAQSWVGSGPNKPVSGNELEQALGPDRIAWLMRETGMSREELLAGLSRDLPAAVDALTPQGRLPTEQEAARFF
jgi:uncharacterized protein YidB (DUF937 family)